MTKNIDIKFIQSEFKKVQNYFLVQDYKKVIEKTQLLIKKDSLQVPFYNYQGLAYRQLGQYQNSEMILKKGLKLFPNSISILCNLGALYRLMDKYEDAENYFNRALDINKNDFNTLCNLANLKRDLNADYDAIDYYKKAYEINNNNEVLLINLAGAYQIIGDFEKSKVILNEIHQKFPSNSKADNLYSTIHIYEENDVHQEVMLKKIKDLNISDDDKINLNFAIAKSYSDQKNFDKSSKYFISGNNCQYKVLKDYDFNQNETTLFKILKEKFKNFTFRDKSQSKKTTLIFIVGLPRSGTTLTHQIISSHSDIFGAGEVPILNDIFVKKIFDHTFLDNFFSNALKNLDEINNFSEQILALFKQYNQHNIILDKSPLNFRWIGFIKILFPNAKIIHCKRNLKDTGLSIYKNVFDGGSLPWSYNQDNLVDFINMYKDLMNFWHNKIPDFIYDCEYENLVNNKVEETKKIIRFCNLDWEENCADHTKNDTGIKTVSISQARKPIYKTSIKLSDKYKSYLEFLNKL